MRRAMRAVLLTAAVLFAPLALGWSGAPLDVGLFRHEAASALRETTAALRALAEGEAASTSVVRERADLLERAAGLPAEQELQDAAALHARATVLLAEGLEGLAREARDVDLDARAIDDEALRRMLGHLGALHAALEPLEALALPTDEYVAALEAFESLLRSKASGAPLMAITPTPRSPLGGTLSVSVLLVGADTEGTATLRMDGAEVAQASARDGRVAFAVPLPLDAAVLGEHVLDVRFVSTRGDVVQASLARDVVRHPTRIVALEGRPVLRSDVPTEESAHARAMIDDALRGARLEGPEDLSALAEPAAVSFAGSATLAPSRAAFQPAPAQEESVQVDVLPWLLGAAALLAVGAVLVGRRRTLHLPPMPVAAAEAAVPVALPPLDVGALPAAPRERVVEAYRRVREATLARGLAQPQETPREWGASVQRAVGQRPRALVSAYERARFSREPLDAPEADQGVDEAVDLARRLS